MRGEHRVGKNRGAGSSAKGDPLRFSRVTAIIGPYGSGKTELTIGLALDARARGKEEGISRVALADLDVLKPYFRSREAADLLQAAGVELLAPIGVLASADLPIIPAEIRGAIGRRDTRILLDVGGDPVGARALGSLADVIDEAGYDLLLVVNRNRPFAESFDSVMQVARDIMGACQLQITGIVSNTHMMEETSLDDVRGGLDLCRQVATALHVDVRLVMVPEGMRGLEALSTDLPPVVTVQRRMKPEFLGGVVLRATRSPSSRRPGSQR